MKTRILFSLIVILSISVIMTLAGFRGYLSPVDHITYNILMNAMHGRKSPLRTSDVALATIDQPSEAQLGMRISNFTRSMLAKAIDNLSSAGAAVIGIDLDLSKPTNPADDNALAMAIKNSGRVVLAAYVANGRLIQPLESFRLFARGEGLINLHIDKDGVLRSTYAVIQNDRNLYLTFPLYVAAQYKASGVPVLGMGNHAIRINDTTIPVHNGSMFINYDSGAPINSIPYYKVITGSFNPVHIKGKIVIIGNTSPLYHDYYSIPLKGKSGRKTLYGVQIYGYAINTILENHFIIYLSTFKVAALVAAFIFLAGILLVIIKKPVFKLITFLGIVIALAASQWILFLHGYFVPLSASYISIPLIVFYAIDYNYVSEYRAHRYIAKAFEHYVSKELLHEIRRNPGSLKLGGEKKEVTVLFSDIRNFTSISESVPPEKLVEFLHIFFNTMTEIIYKHHGVVDKFIGDSIMAIFGAPVSDKHHAEHAVNAGMDMIRAMAGLKKQSTGIIGKEIAIGIGLHTGQAIVGNMGSDKRFDYTAIGDTVNLASRLEGLNKYFGTTCIISDATKNKCSSQICSSQDTPSLSSVAQGRMGGIAAHCLRQVGIVKVKGKTEAIKLYELMDGEQNVFLQQFMDVWDSIDKNDLEHARLLLKSLMEQRPDDRVCRMLFSKVERAISAGGVFDPIIEMQEK
ncbi:MAG: adenylate/guanylate cyclase domain-containing protein [Deltaproteobacteria bacterium]|nr:adenylate/guanylate cyclase domain-containing protein [Deltaproteobacteria bacterium]